MRDSGFRGPRRSFGGPREMHKAVCADCKKECEVPFAPSGDRPVYCQDCFPKHRKPRF
ncbi:CxxC-x17-CxxC domain-containing protein [Methanocella arvoryzae]|uniref:CxxC-x17-CxxC domain-containing protein n=1 Tax=Methanocella arvoryzae TaxID=1175445 RepID=UPI0009DAC99E|nr:CxxC-x17-CxxC domain-containing protein [Methanocella arvoryzae]